MDNTELFDNTIKYLLTNNYCETEDGAYGIIENASDEMITHLTELAAAAAIPAIKGIAGKAAAAGKMMGKASSAMDAAKTAGSVGKKAMKAVSPHSGGESAPVATAESLELVCDYLLDEGIADTAGEVENIYDHMSDIWKSKIIENS